MLIGIDSDRYNHKELIDHKDSSHYVAAFFAFFVFLAVDCEEIGLFEMDVTYQGGELWDWLLTATVSKRDAGADGGAVVKFKRNILACILKLAGKHPAGFDEVSLSARSYVFYAH